jgi:hypothetical protein
MDAAIRPISTVMPRAMQAMCAPNPDLFAPEKAKGATKAAPPAIQNKQNRQNSTQS